MCVSRDHTDRNQLREDEERGFKSAFKKAFNFAKKISKNKAIRNIGRAIISEAPGALEGLSKKLKNKKLKAILNSDITKTKFISFYEIMNEKKRYPFIIMNTDRSDKNDTHWWSFLDLHERKEIFLFDSFGSEGFKEFIIDNDRNILNKILFGIEKF